MVSVTDCDFFQYLKATIFWSSQKITFCLFDCFLFFCLVFQADAELVHKKAYFLSLYMQFIFFFSEGNHFQAFLFPGKLFVGFPSWGSRGLMVRELDL